MEFPAPEARQTVAARDAILYALSVGYGTEPLDQAHLRRTQERDLLPAPTLANVVAHPGPWLQDAGIDWQRLVHAEHRLTIHRPVPIDTPMLSRSRMTAIVDRGPEKGMFATFERAIVTLPDEALVATIVQTNACRGDGGCGSAGAPPEPLASVPARAPDAIFAIAVPEEVRPKERAVVLIVMGLLVVSVYCESALVVPSSIRHVVPASRSVPESASDERTIVHGVPPEPTEVMS